MIPPNENRLVRRLKRRDEDAFREMVTAYQGEIYNLVFRMLGNREEAEDVAQEVFVTVFKSIDSFRGESRFSTWLYRVAINTCKNRYKYLVRRKVHVTQSYEEGQGQAIEAGSPTETHLSTSLHRPDHLLEGIELEKAIFDAIASLDEEQRTLVVLRDIRGLSYGEIVAITGLAEGTVKSRLHRARLTLKDLLQPFQ